MTQAKLTSKVGCFKVRAWRTERNDKVFIKRHCNPKVPLITVIYVSQ
jgi:hypothetical protein